MPVASSMQGRVAGRQAPLGLLLLCLHLPGLSARSLGAAEEKAAPLPGSSLPVPGPASGARPQPSVDPGPGEAAGLPPGLRVPPGGAQAAGREGWPAWPPSWGLPAVESWLPGAPWPLVAEAAEEPAGQALPQELAYLSGAGALPPDSGPLPAAAFSARGAQPSPEASALPQGPEARRRPLASPEGAWPEPLAQRPFWSLIYRLLPGLPWGPLRPSVPWGGGVLGTGWGTRPMPHPSGPWGVGNWFPGGSWGVGNRFPGGSWGVGNRYPGGSRYPGAGWGNVPPRVVRPPGPSWHSPAGSPNPQNPGLEWGWS